MMFCLRSFLPLLLLPLPPSLSPLHLILLLLINYFLNRPCIYCSFLLLILFASSCHWSDRCFVDFSSPASSNINSWFEPRLYSMGGLAPQASPNGTSGIGEMIQDLVNSTAGIVAGAALEGAKAKIADWTSSDILGGPSGQEVASADAGVGLGWLRSLLGKTEWTLPCIDVKIRL